ncbi:YkvA family protein [Echinicola sediminis]
MENWNSEQGKVLDKAKRFYHKKAERIAQSKEKLHQLIQKVSDKLHQFADNPTIKESRFYLDVLLRMVKAYYKNEYRSFSTKTLVLMVLGLLYFVIPFDIIPDFIAGLGFVDDLSVLLAVTKSIQSDIEDFLDWERTKL